MRRAIRELVETPCIEQPIESSEASVFTSNANHKCLQRFHPGVGMFNDGNNSNATLPSKYKISKWIKKTSDKTWLVERSDASGSITECETFIKTAPILNPISFLRGEYSFEVKHPYIPIPGHNWKDALVKINSSNNQAYVDFVCSFVLSRFRELDLMPHFVLYYGGMTAISNTYKYNLTDEYETYRNHKWFWRGLNEKKAKLEMVPHDNDIADLVFSCPFDNSELDNESESDITSELSSLASEVDKTCELDAELESVHSLSSIPSLIKSEKSESDAKSESESDIETEEPEFEVLVNIPEMPVALIYQEAHDGTLDELFELEDLDGAKQGTKAWENKWIAWLWQVIAALSFLQRSINFTHNDLHSNNIVWRKTKKQFLYYRSSTGTVWKIPTYGKIFSIIDFGRAIFNLHDKKWVSDDFNPGEDAGGQYNFGPIYDRSMPLVKPNYSFDLCRLAVSLIDGLFGDEKPEDSELFDLVWSWTIDKFGETIYENSEGDERYSGFKLYIQIATDCENAIPKAQIVKDVFKKFILEDKSSIPKKETVYQV
jgi:hypothetical protein